MRISSFNLVLMLSWIAASASAQTVIEMEGQKPALPQAQEQSSPLLPAPAQPQESSPQPAPLSPAGGRFSFNRVENGFLRLDNENGQVAFCSAQTTVWTCQAVSLDRFALDTEIARLRDEVTALRKEIAALKEPPPPRPPADLTSRPEKSAPDKTADLIIKLPTQEDVARVRDFMEETWRRLVEMITAVQKDMMRRS